MAKKENKGKIHFSNQKNWRYHLELEYDYDYSCWSYGCDEEGICRCGTITDAKVEELTAAQAVGLAHESFLNGSGAAGKFGKVLATRLFRHGLSDLQDMFEVHVCGGYYGDEIDYVELVDSSSWENFQKEIEIFNSASNSERLRQVLEMEYGHILPEVDQYKEWKLVEVPVEQVKASADVLQRCNKEVVEQYQTLTPWFYSHTRNGKLSREEQFPAVLTIPKDGDGWRLIDGFHRFKAWTTKPRHIDAKKWKRLRKKKQIMAIVPVV